MDALLAASGSPWAWIVLGLVLCVVELAAPGAFLIWIGFAAMAVGLINFAVDLPLVWDILVGAALAVVFVILGRRVYGGRDDDAQAGTLNRRAHGLIGQTFQLEGPLENGGGRIRVADSVWRVSGPDMAAGARVRVTGVAADRVTLLVEPA